MDKKKVLVTGSTFPRWKGDTEPRFILDYAKALNEYFDVTVLVPSAPGVKNEEVFEGVKVVRYRYFPIKNLETLCYPGAIMPRIRQKKTRILLVPFLFVSLFFNLIKYSKRVDLVHSHWYIPQGIVQSFIKKPYIITGHGADVTALNKGVFKALKKRTSMNAKHITAVSQHLKNVILDFSGVQNEKISVISMGCDTKAFSPKYRVEDYFDQRDKKVVLFAGRLAEKKGVAYLIDAVKDLDVQLVIAGDGPLKEELMKQAEPLEDKVVFLGSKTHEELRVIYASADIFVAPSITAKDGDQEGFGLVIIEAMASGLPVIASESGGIVDIITHGENGLLSPEKDVKSIERNIKYLLDNPESYNKLMKNGLKTAAEYDYSEIAKKYKYIIEKILEDEK